LLKARSFYGDAWMRMTRAAFNGMQREFSDFAQRRKAARDCSQSGFPVNCLD